MRLLQAITIAVVLGCTLASEKPAPSDFSKLTDKVLEQLLLTDGGKGINIDALEDIVLRLVEINEQAAVLKGRNKQSPLAHHDHYFDAPAAYSDERDSTLELNHYITTGKQPGTSFGPFLSGACDVCASVIGIGGRIVQIESLWPSIISLAKRICPRVTGGFSQFACDGYVSSFDPIVKYVLPNMIKSPYTICGKLLKFLGCGAPDRTRYLWEISLPPRIEFQQAKFDAPAKETFKVLHMTDIHIDPDYKEGTPGRCLEPMCCRALSTPATNGTLPEKEKAGYWSDYRACDTPTYTFEEMIRQVKDAHNDEVDMVFIAGDLPPHDTWNQTAEVHSEIIDFVADTLKAKLPGKPVYFAVGNHEVAPVNTYPLSKEDEAVFPAQWLFDKFSNVWMNWLEGEAVNKTIRQAGFYTTLLKPGWRIISMNDNYCLSQNFLLFGPSYQPDPQGLLKFLVDTLTEAEKNGERVQILGHVPPGDNDCLQEWSWNYYRIITRFSHLITGQFFGHIHRDYFTMYYDAETLTVPTGVAFVGPPGTTFARNNIAYRLYEYNSTTFDLVNYHTYYADIDEENKKGDKTKMTWKLEYSAREAYNLDDMSAKSWSDFTKRMQSDKDLFDKYRNHFQVSLKEEREPCGIECRRLRLCEAYQGLSEVTDEWCERFYPRAKQGADDSSVRKCSARFIRRPDIQ